MIKKVLLSITLLIVIIILASLRHDSISPNIRITNWYHQSWAEFTQQVDVFNRMVNRQHDHAPLTDSILKQYSSLRISFKRIEPIWEYTDPLFVKEYINGAPLPKLDKAAPSLTVVSPKGLQVIDELLGDTKPDWEALRTQTEMLRMHLSDYQPLPKIYDRVVFESMRVSLIRLFTLGLTGFDLPGTDHALLDAQVTWKTLTYLFSSYETPIKHADKGLWKQVNNTINVGEHLLHSQSDFNSFDRLHLLRSAINPLMQLSVNAQYILGIERIEETVSGDVEYALNVSATSLFAPDLLNAAYYHALPKAYQSQSVVSLGKLLFYDPVLSANNERSCASCHQPQKAFTDGQAKSIATGMTGTVNRNSPTLVNCIYSERFFHDLRAEGLEDQMEHVVASKDEFNTSILAILSKLNQSKEYQDLFAAAFPNAQQPISKQNISFAITAFVSSLQAFNSPFDRYARGETNALSASAKRGFNLFMGKAACGTCHFAPVFNGTVPPTFTESESEVLGVPLHPHAEKLILDSDLGRGQARLKEQADFYMHSFKTPTIRNIALTAPYMHNGAYKTLEEVMDFYNNGGGAGMGIHVPYQTLSSDSLYLTKAEISDIIAFMTSLTDTASLTSQPSRLPLFETQANWNARKVGGNY